MAIFLFFLTWILVSLLTDRPEIGFVIAVLSVFIFRQGKRISQLEDRLKELKPEELRPRSEPLKIPDAQKAAASPPVVPVTQPRLEPARAEVASRPPQKTESSQQAPSWSAAPQATKAAPSRPAQVPGPTFSEMLERTLGPSLAGFVLRGNPIARVGVVILLFGVVFLLKFAADEGFIPIELRLLGAALGAFVLLGIGWKKRGSKPQIALTLQGAGAGVFYVTTFIAFKLYHFIPGPFAFVLLVAITVLSSALAVLQNASALAVLAMIGAFLAPALTSEGGGNHVLLFSYLSLLNLGIFGICLFRSWRAVNLTGFFFTFSLAVLWGARDYRAELFATTEPFLLFFVILYSVINVVFSLRSTADKPGAVDTMMTFGTPFLGMLLQYRLVSSFEYGMAFSAAGFGAFHLALARYAFNKDRAKLRFLIESYFAVGLAFLSLAVPFAFSERLTAAVWALEAVALLWSGIRQKHFLTRIGGHVLLVLSSLAFLSDVSYGSTDVPFLNPFFVSVVLLCGACLFAGALLGKASDADISSSEKRCGVVYLCAALLWWFGGGYVEVWRHLSDWNLWLTRTIPSFTFYWIPFGIFADSLFASLSVLGFWAIARRWRISGLSLIRHLLLPAHYFVFLLLMVEGFNFTGIFKIHPFNSFGFISWPVLFAVHYFILKREEQDSSEKIQPMSHLLPLWLGTALVSWQAFWFVNYFVEGGDSWRLAALSLMPAVALLAVSRAAFAAGRWPFSRGRSLYLQGLLVLAVWSFFWPLLLNLCSSGDARPLPYVPLVHPLDLAQIVTVVALIRWWKRSALVEVNLPVSSSAASGLLGASLFVWSTALLFRASHHYVGIPWDLDALFDSSFIQSALSIYWSVLALVLMLLAHAKSWRPVWKFGAFLIFVVVVKLLLVDMSNQGTVARISAFMGVGLLMLVIGYFAPIPPEKMPPEKAQKT
jgi:uncharacterized membrane protein